MSNFSHDLSSKAMLAGLSISVWSAAKYDAKISRQVSEERGADVSVGRYRKRLRPKEWASLDQINSISAAAREYYYFHTLAWDNDGQRILPGVKYFTFTQKIEEFTAQLGNAADTFCSPLNYQAFKDQVRKELPGDLYQDEDFPKDSEIRRKFGMRLKILPLSAADDFRVNLGREAEQEIKEQTEANMKEIWGGALTDVYRRIHKCVSDMAGKLSAMEVTPDKRVRHPFRDTVVEPLTELVEVLPSLNIMGDKTLESMGQLLKDALLVHPPQKLRDDFVARKSTAAAADAIAKRMAAYLPSMEAA